MKPQLTIVSTTQDALKKAPNKVQQTTESIGNIKQHLTASKCTLIQLEANYCRYSNLWCAKSLTVASP